MCNAGAVVVWTLACVAVVAPPACSGTELDGVRWSRLDGARLGEPGWELQFPRDTNTTLVRIDSCDYPVPWRTPVVQLQGPCSVCLPVCGPGHVVRLRIQAPQWGAPLWRFRWDNHTFEAVPVAHGVWLQWDQEVYVLPQVSHWAWVRAHLHLTATHLRFGVQLPTADNTTRWVHADLPWRAGPTPHFVSCCLGESGGQLESLQWDAGVPVYGARLLAHSPDPAACALRLAALPVQRHRWHTTEGKARLRVSTMDLLRCRPVEGVQLWPAYQLNGTLQLRTDTYTLVPLKYAWSAVPHAVDPHTVALTHSIVRLWRGHLIEP